MTDGPDSLGLQLLRRIDEKFDRVGDGVHELKVRLTGVEEGVAGIHRRMDRLDGRVERIERRLDLVEH